MTLWLKWMFLYNFFSCKKTCKILCWLLPQHEETLMKENVSMKLKLWELHNHRKWIQNQNFWWCCLLTSNKGIRIIQITILYQKDCLQRTLIKHHNWPCRYVMHVTVTSLHYLKWSPYWADCAFTKTRHVSKIKEMLHHINMDQGMA